MIALTSEFGKVSEPAAVFFPLLPLRPLRALRETSLFYKISRKARKGHKEETRRLRVEI
jgi:hypothetical protein